MSNKMQSYKCIDVSEAKELIINNKVTIADIRDTGSYQEGNISDSINLTDQNIEEFMETADRSGALLVYCYDGNNSVGAAEYFVDNGFTSVFSLDGGYAEYSQQDSR